MFLRLFIAAILFFSSAMAAIPGFEEKKLQILTVEGKQEFTVLIADTALKREHGLMMRETLPENTGMLFLFGKEVLVNMWMKDTYIPLDMVFIKSDHTIARIVYDTEPLSLETIASKEKVVAVLELNAGICKKFGIKKNDKIVF